MIMTILSYLLANPGQLAQIGMTLQACVIHYLKLDPEFRSDQIGGDFTASEKKYIYELALMQKKWDEQKAKNSHNRSVVEQSASFDKEPEKNFSIFFQSTESKRKLPVIKHSRQASSLMYPSKEYVKVLFLTYFLGRVAEEQSVFAEAAQR